MTTLFPDICTDDVRAARDFYVELLGFVIVFETDWYVQLQDPDNAAVQIAFVERSHPSVPPSHRAPASGVIITVERDDVDAVHARALGLGLTMLVDLRDEPWGQRHFITQDPDGLALDVVRLIPPSPEYASAYARG
jgi:catechol 2,3-dioxygenase-like lactoylglutathione lyase family enzyme